MKIKSGYTGFGFPADGNCVRSSRFLVDALLNSGSAAGVTLASLSEDEDSEPALVDRVIDVCGVPDVESLYTPASGGHEPIVLPGRDRSRSPRRPSVKELLVSGGSVTATPGSQAEESGDVSDDATSDSESEPARADGADAAAPVQPAAACVWSDSDPDDAAAPAAQAGWALSDSDAESQREAPPPACARSRSRSTSSQSSSSTSSSSSAADLRDDGNVSEADSLEETWLHAQTLSSGPACESPAAAPVPPASAQPLAGLLRHLETLGEKSDHDSIDVPIVGPSPPSSPARSLSSQQSNPASPRPRVRGPDLTPLARLPNPDFHPDIKWWAQPVWDYFSTLMKRYPRRPRRAILLELQCAGSGGEVEGLKVPKARPVGKIQTQKHRIVMKVCIVMTPNKGGKRESRRQNVKASK